VTRPTIFAKVFRKTQQGRAHILQQVDARGGSNKGIFPSDLEMLLEGFDIEVK